MQIPTLIFEQRTWESVLVINTWWWWWVAFRLQLNWWKGKPSGRITCTKNQQSRFNWSCSSKVCYLTFTTRVTLTSEQRNWTQCATHRLNVGMEWCKWLQISLLVTQLWLVHLFDVLPWGWTCPLSYIHNNCGRPIDSMWGRNKSEQ